MTLPRPAMILRRLHLYLGLALFPWAILYGVTAFLFNHPNAFPDQETRSISPADLLGTPLESPPSPRELAASVVAELNRRESTVAGYSLSNEPTPRFTREFAFATAKDADGGTLSILLEATGTGGTLRKSPPKTAEPSEPAPFAINIVPKKTASNSGRAADPLTLPDPLPERVQATVQTLLPRLGYVSFTDLKVTSVPPVTFQMTDATGRAWTATYDATSGSLSGKPAASETPEAPSTRRFLLRMHTAHGYPSQVGPRWYWAIIVDLMAFVLLFWGGSGLVMWWQLKSQRILGILILLVSATLALAIGWGMHCAIASGS